MAHHWLSRFIPSQKQLEQHKYLKYLGSLLHCRDLWRLNHRTIPKAVGIGVFCAFMPMPFQMFLATLLAIYFHANLPLSVTAVWLSNPFTMLPMFYGAYIVGKKILNTVDLPIKAFNQIALSDLIHHIDLIWKPFLVGTIVCGFFFGAISYSLAKFVSRYVLLNRYKKHQQRKELRRQRR